jgi:hypothetical protein
VGFACHELGCQHYPFPLKFFGFPVKGNFTCIVGNLKSGNSAKENSTNSILP